MRAALWALLLAFTLTACGGDDGGSISVTPPRSRPGSLRRRHVWKRSKHERSAASSAPVRQARPRSIRPRAGASSNRSGSISRRPNAAAAISTLGPVAATSTDIGDIAVLRDEGDLIVPANAFDLKGLGLRFTPQFVRAATTSARPTPAFRTAIGNRITLSDDDTLRADVSFSFPFFSANERTAFVNSDGNVTFREGDSASTDRSVGRLLTGPPRVAPFLADLDPSAGGGVFVNSASDQYTVTWCNVRGFDSTRTTSAQATLLPDGSIEMQVRLRHHSARRRRRRLARAHDSRFPRRRSQRAGADAAAAPRLSASASRRTPISTSVATANAFYRTHPDAYDQLVIWTDTTGRVRRRVRLRIDHRQRDSGHRRRHLRHVAGVRQRRPAAQLHDDGPARQVSRTIPTTRFLGENNTLSVLGQEVGHRWLAYFNFRRPYRAAVRRAARARSRSLELLHGLGRVGHGGQRHRGSRRRLVPHRRRGAALQPARSVRDGPGAARGGAAVLLRAEPGRTCRSRRTRTRRRRSASPSTAPAATC